LLDARPFKRFVVYTNSAIDEGTLIDDPASASLEDDGETLIVSSHRGSGVRWTRLIDLTLVTMIAIQEGKSDRE
jgi:hypothetical protein